MKGKKIELNKMEIKNKEKGITLVSLVVTVIVLLILAGVAINLTVGDNGIFTRAIEATDRYKAEEIIEKIELIKANTIIDNKGKFNIDDFFDNLVEEGIIGDREEIIDNGDGSYTITTEEGYVIDIIEKDEGKDIEIEYVGKGDKIGPRIKEIHVKNKTTSTIEIEVEASNANGAKYTYSYKLEDEEKYKEAAKGIEENTYKYENLEANKIYNIKVEVENKGIKAEKVINVLTGTLPEGAISIGEVIWENGKAKVEVNINKEIEGNLKLEYKINEEGNWIEIQDGGIIENLEHNQTIYVRLTDGTNETEYLSTKIEDNIAPTVSISTSGLTYNSVKLTVTAIDNQSGLSEEGVYTYYLDDVQKISNNTNSYTYTGLTVSTKYTLKVVVKDKVGNVAEKSTTITTTDYPIVSAADITANAIEYYGAEVTGYTCTNSAAVTKWRIFYADSTNIYLIADDYIASQYAPNGQNGNSIYVNSTYKLSMNNVYEDYTGAEWISTNSKGKKWLSQFLNSYRTSTNVNIRAVAYMMDTNVWSTFAGTKAEYAMGGPTLELFCASYKQTHPSKYIDYNIGNSNGYEIKLSTDSSYNSFVEGLPKDDFNQIYIKSDTSKANGMWLACTSFLYSNGLMHAHYSGGVYSTYYNTTPLGFRPIVCLKSDVRLKKTSGGVYAIQ